ncbi:MAG: multicopper oxidase domain-containing protein, partial [Paracoccaceae bacterium]
TFASSLTKTFGFWSEGGIIRGETVDVALVADNPGDWAFHCHVIEHQKTGLAGYLRVS